MTAKGVRPRMENRELREWLAWTLGELRVTGSHRQVNTRTSTEGQGTIGPCS